MSSNNHGVLIQQTPGQHHSGDTPPSLSTLPRLSEIGPDGTAKQASELGIMSAAAAPAWSSHPAGLGFCATGRGVTSVSYEMEFEHKEAQAGL
jgi:hypothetical protein